MTTRMNLYSKLCLQANIIALDPEITIQANHYHQLIAHCLESIIPYYNYPIKRIDYVAQRGYVTYEEICLN